jgi:DNA-binding NtrC family response regulator
VETGDDALRFIERNRPDAVVLDLRLPDMSGLDVFDQIRESDPRLPVILITAYSTTDTAINAMKAGAFDYILKPVDIHHLRELVRKAVEVSRLQHDPAIFDGFGNDTPVDLIVGRAPAMQEVYKAIGRVASEDVIVLLLGESGTGKELVAQAIHHHSLRSRQPFLAINCAALPETLLESELFGHERGAFTGAEQTRIGKFEQAHGGTLFLDEVGDMTPATQAKVLRVLQDGCFERVGGSETIQTDARVIAATNQDLDSRIATNEFRRDLLYRLNGFTIRLPALRERMEDLPLLVEHFLKQSNDEFSKRAATLSPETMAVLGSSRWPGNVRELQSVIKYAVVHSVGEIITPECLPETFRAGSPNAAAVPSRGSHDTLAGLAPFIRQLLHSGELGIYARVVAEMDRLVLRETLRHHQGNQVQASRVLGMSRTTLRSKLADLGLDQEDFR